MNKELLEAYQKLLRIYEIESFVYLTNYKNRTRDHYILQIHGENVFRFLEFVDDYKKGDEWKQICASKMKSLKQMRRDLSQRGD